MSDEIFFNGVRHLPASKAACDSGLNPDSELPGKGQGLVASVASATERITAFLENWLAPEIIYLREF